MIFKTFSEILNNTYRIIEFNSRRSIFSDLKNSDERFLSIIKSSNKGNTSDASAVILNPESFITAIARNSTDIIILNSTGFRELKAIYRTPEAFYFYQLISLLNLPLLVYFFIKHLLAKKVKFVGLYTLKKNSKVFFYLGLKRERAVEKRTRHYLSPLIKIEDFFEGMNEEKIKYVVLRWFENLPEVETDEDVDLLVDDADLEKLHVIIDSQPGIRPFDIYSKSGKPGSDFQNMPYYILSLSEKVLNEAVLFKNKFKVPSIENYFYTLAYHAVFHKGENSGLRSEKYELKVNGKPDHDYLSYLKKISAEANIQFENFTLEGLHSFLDSKGFSAPLDTLYKLSISNHYLKTYLKEYQKSSDIHSKYEGLVCFVAREKVVEHGLLDDMVKYIKKEGFTILRLKSLEEPSKSRFTKLVRGGNWNQGPWPVSGGLPAVVIVALDVYPVKPEDSDYQLHPGLTNRRIIYKNKIRDLINNSLNGNSEWFNGIHSSDNETQALEYLSLAGIDEKEIFNEIIRHKNSFVTNYPVIKQLSQYSKRAKVELIDYNGIKAVKKTFKPDCENFLENEIKVYSVFQNSIPVPKLLETGHNYIITSYIEDSRHLKYRVNIKTLKKCLSILRQVYDTGYSLLDFKPGNFLIDRNKKIYLIDFEFLYKYGTKPDFLECYDLVGATKKIDSSLLPNYSIPDKLKLFDLLWYGNTGVKYSELSDLDSSILKIKSFYRHYILRVNNRLLKIEQTAKSVIKKFYRHLP